jgi:hypothetical protein
VTARWEGVVRKACPRPILGNTRKHVQVAVALDRDLRHNDFFQGYAPITYRTVREAWKAALGLQVVEVCLQDAG